MAPGNMVMETTITTTTTTDIGIAGITIAIEMPGPEF